MPSPRKRASTEDSPEDQSGKTTVDEVLPPGRVHKSSSDPVSTVDSRVEVQDYIVQRAFNQFNMGERIGMRTSDAESLVEMDYLRVAVDEGP